MNKNQITVADLRGLVLFTAFVYLAIRFIGAIAGILLIFGIILLATLILNPLVAYLERHKVPRTLGVIIIVITGLGLIALVSWLIAPYIARELSQIASEGPNYLSQIRGWLGRELPALARRLPTSGETLTKQVFDKIPTLLGGLTGYAVNVVNLIVSAVLIFICVIYALFNPRPLVQGFFNFIPKPLHQRVVDAFQDLSQQLKAWAVGTIIGMLLIFVLTWIAMAILGLRAAFIVGVIAGLLEIVPILGPIVAGTLAALLALGQDPSLTLWVIVVFTIIQQTESHLIIPLVMSGQVQQHPISIIFFILVMGGLFGLIGVFLAVPAAVTAKILVYKFYIEPRTESEQEHIHKETEKIVSGRYNNKPEDEH